MRNAFLQPRAAWLLLTFPLIFGSCDDFSGKRVHGNGNTRTEDRPVSDFKNVEIGGAAKVLISQGDQASVKLEGDDNLLQYITVRQEGDKIYIHEKDGIHLVSNNNLRIYVTAPLFHSIDVSGACDVTGQTKISSQEHLDVELSGAGNLKMEIDAPSIKVECSGTGAIYLKGQTKNAEIGISGVGSAHCYDLMAENTSVEISGVGSAEVYASVKLDAEVSGAGSVKYKGDAAEVSKHVSGAGSVHKAD
jgi:hypothetical protein